MESMPFFRSRHSNALLIACKWFERIWRSHHQFRICNTFSGHNLLVQFNHFIVIRPCVVQHLRYLCQLSPTTKWWWITFRRVTDVVNEFDDAWYFKLGFIYRCIEVGTTTLGCDKWHPLGVRQSIISLNFHWLRRLWKFVAWHACPIWIFWYFISSALLYRFDFSLKLLSEASRCSTPSLSLSLSTWISKSSFRWASDEWEEPMRIAQSMETSTKCGWDNDASQNWFSRKKHFSRKLLLSICTIEQLGSTRWSIAWNETPWWRRAAAAVAYLLLQFRIVQSVRCRDDRWIWTNYCYGLIFIVFVCDTWCSANGDSCNESMGRRSNAFCINSAIQWKRLQCNHMSIESDAVRLRWDVWRLQWKPRRHAICVCCACK